jgi:hypothetical protein
MLPKFVFPILALPSLLAGTILAQESQRDAARQFNTARTTQISVARPGVDPGATLAGDEAGESFGVQEILQDAARIRPFRVFADISAFATNNVALTRRDREGDAFLLATFGFEYRRDLPKGFQIETSVQYATFRYNEFRELDFDSLDAGIGLNYHSGQLGGLDLFVRYNFNALIASGDNDAFFQNHTVTTGVQKTVSLGGAHSVYAGISGQVAWSDPKIAERSEWVAYAGYHVQATRHLDGDLQYRYGYLHYNEQDRADHNHALSASLRYRFTDWCTASASTYVAWNRSDNEVFNYGVANVGGGLTLSLQF